MDLDAVRRSVWGDDVKSEIFKRWSQGFNFSKSEPSALEQFEGGPCAVLAPVQAFILKDLLVDYEGFEFRDKMNAEIQDAILTRALVEILDRCRSKKFHIFHHSAPAPPPHPPPLDPAHSPTASSLLPLTESHTGSSKSTEMTSSITTETVSPPFPFPIEDEEIRRTEDDEEKFHRNLTVREFVTKDETLQYFRENVDVSGSKFGVLLFLYSVIKTRGLELVKSDSDSSEPLIDATYGYGSQSLINLMLTGQATTYVWDHDQDVGGLRLKGITSQNDIGFITIMEHLRFCTVGSFYKNPKHPVWIVGSDTHLTVLFSDEAGLVSPETGAERARRVFRRHDPDGNNFIEASRLGDVLRDLDLVADAGYVDVMRRRLDVENLGIILLNAFMDEFFPPLGVEGGLGGVTTIESSGGSSSSRRPDMFTLAHYNGFGRSNVSGEVRYHIGSAILLESDIKSVCESNPMLTVLQTKWPNIEVTWCDDVTPSLN